MRYSNLLGIPCAFMAAGLAAPAAYAKVTAASEAGVTTMTFDVEDVAFRDAPSPQKGLALKAARLVGADGYEAVDFKVGAPELPVLRFFADGDVTVETGAAAKAGKLGKAQLTPNQPSRSKSGAAPAFIMNPAAYASKAATPAYTVTAAGSVNGVARKLVTLYPLAYAPASGDWQLRPHYTVRIKHAPKVADAAAGKEIFAFVVGERFAASPSLAAYVALKQKLGFAVETIKVAAATTPEDIRAALQAQLKRTDAHLKYALIIGEAADVPGKESDNISGVTDHYYRAIDTDDYAADINGPDIGVGRVSVDSEDQLAAVLGKFTRYTQGAFADETWLNSVAFIATDDRYEVAEGTHNYAVDTYTAPRQYRGAFPAAEQLGGDKLYPITYHVTSEKVVSTINEGRTIVDYSGHGSNTSWAGPEVSQDDVRSLTNRDALPFVIGNACITGDYRVPEAFAETWQRHPAGAITYWGSMDSTYWDEDDLLERYMFDHIYRDGALAFGDITSYALGEVWKHYGGAERSKYYWETYHVFGDPSLDLRTTRTRHVAVDGPAALPVGVSTVDYKVSDAAGPVAGARIALGVAGQAGQVAVTDADGKVTFDLGQSAQSVATLAVVVSGQNTVLAENTLQIIPANNPYLAFNTYKIADRADQTLFVGETAALTFNVQNLGLQPTQGGTITLAGIDGPATIVSDSVEVRALAARDTYRIESGTLAVKVANDAQSGDRVALTLKWLTKEGQTATVPVTLRVLRAKLNVTKVDFGQGEDGGIQAGQSGPVYLTVKNVGSEAIGSGSLKAEGTACVTAAAGELTVANLAPGAEVRLAQALTIGVDAACANGDAAKIHVAGVYQSVARAVGLGDSASFPVGVLSTVSRDAGDLSVAIKDDATIEQTLDTAMTGVVKDLAVHVKLTHSYVGDLVIKLVHPDGTTVTLQDRQGGAGDDLDVVFGMGGTAVSDLAKLRGKSAAGTWKVTIEDTAAQDEGTLKGVGLTIKGYLNAATSH